MILSQKGNKWDLILKKYMHFITFLFVVTDAITANDGIDYITNAKQAF